jgi:hypothetical protein
LKEITRARSAWRLASKMAPQITEAPTVAVVLDGLCAAIENADESGLQALVDAARRALGETSKQGGRRPDRARALDWLAEMMDGYLSRGGRLCECRGCKKIRGEPIRGTVNVYCAARLGWKFTSRLTSEGMANGFVAILPNAGAFALELTRAKVLLPGAFWADPDRETKTGAVMDAFDRLLQRQPRASGEDLVRVGVRALGYDQTKAIHLFDYRHQRTARA